MSTTSIQSMVPSPRLRARARPLVVVIIFLAAFVGFSAALETMLPLPDVGDVSQKLAFYTRHKDEYNTVFVGSSRVYRQIAPAVFDRTLNAANGPASHSLNMGAPSMFLPESLFVIDRILALKPARLQRLFIELDDPKLRAEEHAGLVRREVYWHGPEETALTCANILTAHSIRWLDRVSMLGHQVLLMVRRFTHLGRGWDLWSAFSSTSAPAETPPDETGLMGADRDGFAPYRATLGEGTDRKGGQADVKRYLADLAVLRARREHPRRAQRTTALLRWVLRRKLAALRARGIEPFFVVAPVTTGEEGFLRLPAENVPATLLAFNDPNAYPELYAVNARADTIHLNERGSLLFTRLLAERVVALDRAPPHTAPSHAVR